MARQRMSASKLAPQVGMTQSALSRRLTGDVPFDVDELVAIAVVLDVPPARFFPRGAYESPRPDGPGGGQLPRQDSNLQPAGYEYPQVSALLMAA